MNIVTLSNVMMSILRLGVAMLNAHMLYGVILGCPYYSLGEYPYNTFAMLNVLMLDVAILSTLMPSVVHMQSIFRLSILILSVVMLNFLALDDVILSSLMPSVVHMILLASILIALLLC
jgi:hypothetical protein